jgi:transposase
MDIHLDRLLNFPNVTVQSCVHEDEGIRLDLEFIKEGSHCPKCQHFSDDLHRNRPRLIRDLSIFGKQTYLRIHRRQYFCSTCQSYFTERLSLANSKMKCNTCSKLVVKGIQRSDTDGGKPICERVIEKGLY